MGDGGTAVSFDAERATEVAREAVDRVLVVATYTDEGYALQYVDPTVRERYERDDAADSFETVGDQIHRYAQLDFFERGVFTDLVPEADRVCAFATFTDAGTIVWVVTADEEGLFVSAEPGSDVTALVSALDPVVGDTE
jgi:hypothetical protein